MATASNFENFVLAYITKHKCLEFAHDIKSKENAWTFVQEVFTEGLNVKTCKSKLKGMAVAGLYAACLTMNAEIGKLKDNMQLSKNELTNLENEKELLTNQVTSLTNINKLLKSTADETLQKYKAAQAAIVEHKIVLTEIMSERDNIVNDFKVLQEQLNAARDGTPVDHVPYREREHELKCENSVLKQKAVVMEIDLKCTDPVCVNDPSKCIPQIPWKQTSSTEQSPVLPIAMGEVTSLTSNGKGTITIEPGQDSDTADASRDLAIHDIPVSFKSILCSNSGDKATALQCNSPDQTVDHNPIDINRPMQPLKTLMGVAQSIGKMSPADQITSHDANCKQRCELEVSYPAIQAHRTIPFTKRSSNTKNKIQCHGCFEFGHIKRYCYSLGREEKQSFKKESRFRTTRRETEVYSSRWGTWPRHNGQDRPQIPLNPKMQNKYFKVKINHLKYKVHTLAQQLQTALMEIRETRGSADEVPVVKNLSSRGFARG